MAHAALSSDDWTALFPIPDGSKRRLLNQNAWLRSLGQCKQQPNHVLLSPSVARRSGEQPEALE